MKRTPAGGWDLAEGFELFSNAHDPRLASLKSSKRSKVTRYVLGARDRSCAGAMAERGDVTISPADLSKASANDTITVKSDYGELTFTLPDEYRPGDIVKCRVLAPYGVCFYARGPSLS